MKPYVVIRRNNRGKTTRRIEIAEDIDHAIAFARANNQNAFWHPVKAEVPTIQDLYDHLERFDWFFEMSDDRSVWARGKKATDELTNTIVPFFGEPGRKLHGAFVSWINGRLQDDEQATKPERPE